MDRFITLDVPKNGFSIAHHERRKELRAKNTLYLPARKIDNAEFNTDELTMLAKEMRAFMNQKKGIGLAANQVGKRIQIFIVEAKNDNPRYKILGAVPYQIFINPKITGTSVERKNFWHGCLSAMEEKRGNVATYEWIEYEARNVEGKIQKGRLTGLSSVIFQHEFRHLLGGTYLDKASQFMDQAELSQKIEHNEVPFFETTDKKLPLLISDYQIGESLEDFYSRQ